jgi:hypothetical protein
MRQGDRASTVKIGSEARSVGPVRRRCLIAASHLSTSLAGKAGLHDRLGGRPRGRTLCGHDIDAGLLVHDAEARRREELGEDPADCRVVPAGARQLDPAFLELRLLALELRVEPDGGHVGLHGKQVATRAEQSTGVVQDRIRRAAVVDEEVADEDDVRGRLLEPRCVGVRLAHVCVRYRESPEQLARLCDRAGVLVDAHDEASRSDQRRELRQERAGTAAQVDDARARPDAGPSPELALRLDGAGRHAAVARQLGVVEDEGRGRLRHATSCIVSTSTASGCRWRSPMGNPRGVGSLWRSAG